jgi:hypothetical protein
MIQKAGPNLERGTIRSILKEIVSGNVLVMEDGETQTGGRTEKDFITTSLSH